MCTVHSVTKAGQVIDLFFVYTKPHLHWKCFLTGRQSHSECVQSKLSDNKVICRDEHNKHRTGQMDTDTDSYRCPADYNDSVQDGALEFLWRKVEMCRTNKLINDINEMSEVYLIHMLLDRKNSWKLWMEKASVCHLVMGDRQGTRALAECLFVSLLLHYQLYLIAVNPYITVWLCECLCSFCFWLDFPICL